MSDAGPFELSDRPEVGPTDFVATIPPGITTKKELLDALAGALRFPDYFGANWDALVECIEDLEWLEPHTIVLRHADVPALPEAELRTYLEILADARTRWSTRSQHALRVVFPERARATLADPRS